MAINCCDKICLDPYRQPIVKGKLSKCVEAMLYYYHCLYESLHYYMLMKGSF